ncbi:hypothetical protein AURDEDRAFT_114548 [Auricularia subglabra TFB-10046 SS5]|nr:hypothetical protein AURDEDRAFT_114548 [Auricularia subglabra TFB-10046 SS5]
MWPRHRIPTVHDLRVRRCFICLDEEEGRGRRHGFVHACSCTLVAHEQCLLAWTASGGPERLRCAQCRTPYSIVRRTPFVLRILDAGHTAISRAGGLVFMGSVTSVGLGIVGAVYLGSVSYGCYAARWVLGRDLFAHALDISEPTKWSPGAWMVLPAIPITFLWASTGTTKWLPFETVRGLCAWIVSSVPIRPLDAATAMTPVSAGAVLKRMLLDWPPAPFLIALLFPTVRDRYISLRAAIAARFNIPDAAAPARRNVHGVPQELFLNMQRGPDADLHINIAARDAVAQGEPVNGIAIGRTVGVMLLLPPFAGWVGRMLRRLGLALGPNSPVGRFLCVGQPNRDNAWKSYSFRFATAQLGLRTWGDFEPVWWHSLLGLALLAIARDATSLTYSYLKAREKESRYVVDLPFIGVDHDALDLIPD